MYLLIDAGNTRVKWAVPAALPLLAAQKPDWLHEQAVLHAGLAELQPQWQQLAASMKIDAVLISNVAGAAMRERLQAMLDQAFPQAIVQWFASSAECAGLRNDYRQPSQLGCDRFASAIAAHHLHPQRDLIVATGGTATTVDAVLAEGRFIGGMILPGLKLMAESLAKNTAQLPQVAESIAVDQPFADHTDQAIVSGCIHAQTGAILQAVHSLGQRTGKAPLCIISGGAAPYLQAFLPQETLYIPNLVLTGLAVVAQSQRTDF